MWLTQKMMASWKKYLRRNKNRAEMQEEKEYE